nr:hypothetical protein BaRGS_027214 [Batillaria attramentaria]
MRRILAPAYQDGISEPRILGRNGGPLTSARDISNMLHPTGPNGQMTSLTHMVMQWGQFIDHDLTSTPVQTGKLKTSSRDLLPKDQEETCVVHNPATDYCFKADGASQYAHCMVEQHNRLVEQLALINPHWDDERLFQEARKIVGALIQQVTYGEWLPIVLDPGRMARNDLNLLGRGRQGSLYDPEVDASIRNVFGTAAFRFGHSLIRDTMSQLTHNYMDAGSWRLEQIFGNYVPDPVITGARCGHVYEGACQGPAKHGTQNDIDIFSGGISELREGGGLVGPTFACLIAEQFRNVKIGDRFWYETSDRNTGFTRDSDWLYYITRRANMADMCIFNRQGGNMGMCFGDSQQIRQCSDREWMAQWGEWSMWFDCFRGVQRRNRLCQGYSNPCPGSPEESRVCTSTMNKPKPGGPWSLLKISFAPGKNLLLVLA